jgi:hypothetical protein
MIPGAGSLCCPDCQAALDLHQPDVDQPTQLLGICKDCSKWFYLLEHDDDWDRTMLFELPSVETIRRACASTKLE